MFNNQKKMAKTTPTGNPERLNRIVEGTLIQGEIKSESNIRIDGSVKGHIATKGRLVFCQNADIEGTINGKMTVSELLTLKATSKLKGDIITKKLAIDPGAVFNGSCSMGAVVKDLMQKEEQKQQSQLANAR